MANRAERRAGPEQGRPRNLVSGVLAPRSYRRSRAAVHVVFGAANDRRCVQIARRKASFTDVS